jgi:hypothetical protein
MATTPQSTKSQTSSDFGPAGHDGAHQEERPQERVAPSVLLASL